MCYLSLANCNQLNLSTAFPISIKMILPCCSITTSKVIIGNKMILRLFLYDICENQNQQLTIMNQIIARFKNDVIETNLSTCTKYQVFSIYIFQIVLNLVILKYLVSLIYLGLKRMVFNLFFLYNFFMKYPLLSKREPKRIFHQRIFKSSTSKLVTISIITFFIILIKQDDTITKFWKTIITLIAPELSIDCINWRTGMGCEMETIIQGRSYMDKNINISHCFFSRSSQFSGSGSVIYVSGGTYMMNVNYSMFFNCFCTSEGGAIYFSSSNSYLRMICANGCSASSQYHFAYLSASHTNLVEYLSISNCSPLMSRYHAVFLAYSNQRADNSNSSMNNAEMGSGFYTFSPSSFTSSYCTFSNNKVYLGVCLWFNSESGTILISYANIVHNNSPSQYGVIFCEKGGQKRMLYCLFQNNRNYLFYVSSGSIEVSYSFIDHSSSFSSATSVSTESINSFTYRMTYQIHFYSSLHCNADLPLLESHNETPYRSFAEIICSCQIVDMGKISVIFSFSFVFLSYIL